MYSTKNVVLLPYWALATFTRHKQPIADLFDFEKVRALFSANDLAEILAVNRKGFDYVLGVKDFPVVGESLFGRWYDTASEKHCMLLADTIETLASANATSACARLFDPINYEERFEEAFSTIDVPGEALILVIYPGFFTTIASGSLQFRALQAILKTLYVYCSVQDVALTPWFRQYLLGLSNKQHLL